MKTTKYVQPLIDAMAPKRRPGAVAKVTQCPYCGSSMSQTNHAAHRRDCKEQFRQAPPQPADFENDAGGGYNPNCTFPQT
jgi:hypothetical protein